MIYIGVDPKQVTLICFSRKFCLAIGPDPPAKEGSIEFIYRGYRIALTPFMASDRTIANLDRVTGTKWKGPRPPTFPACLA
jgi:hypothetical protein